LWAEINDSLRGKVRLEGPVTLDLEPKEWLLKLGREIARKLEEGGHEVGHFKMSLDGGGKRWRVHQVMDGDEVELMEEGSATQGGTPELHILVNLKAEGDAEVLQGFVYEALAAQTEA
jgi:hypothetical protein